MAVQVIKFTPEQEERIEALAAEYERRVMANFENLAVKQIQEGQRLTYREGIGDGIDGDVNQVPEWWFKVAAGYMTPYMRGYFVGRELKIEDAKQQAQDKR